MLRMIGTTRVKGFALPTVLITSLAMMIVLLASLQAATSIQVAITNQYYAKVTEEAGQSGLAMAQECFKQNADWTGKQLTPYTDCNGNRLASCPSSSDTNSCNFVLRDGNVRSSYAVSPPVDNGDLTYTFTVNTTMQVLRASTVGTATPLVFKSSSSTVSGIVSYQQLPPIKSGNYTNCAISSGALYCWGYNYYGQIGNGNKTTVTVPTRALGDLQGKYVYDVATGYYATCAIAGNAQTPTVGDGGVYCWGTNNYGQFGNTSYAINAQQLTPKKMIDVSYFGSNVALTSISGRNNNCVVTDTSPGIVASGSNLAYCWGQNNSGNSGDSITGSSCLDNPACNQDPKLVPSSYPLKTSGGLTFHDITQLTAIAFQHGCLINSADNRVYCWGANSEGQFGNGYTPTTNSTRAYLTDSILSNPIKLYTNRNDTCVLNGSSPSNRKIYCFGNNGNPADYRNDNVSTIEWHTPVDMTRNATGSAAIISTASDYVTQVAMADSSTCFLKSTGKVYCWGYNEWGQLGQPADGPGYVGAQTPTITGSGSAMRPLPPQSSIQVNFPNAAKISQISAAYASYCAVTDRAATYCWGKNSLGELGIGTTSSGNACSCEYVPQKVNYPVKTLVY